MKRKYNDLIQEISSSYPSQVLDTYIFVVFGFAQKLFIPIARIKNINALQLVTSSYKYFCTYSKLSDENGFINLVSSKTHPVS